MKHTPTFTEAKKAVIAQPFRSHPAWQFANDLRGKLWVEERIQGDIAAGNIPSSIKSKKSWSPAFKEHVFTQERMQMDAFFKELERSQSFREQVMLALGMETK